MTKVYDGVDNEFAVSTGSNVGTTSNSSTFDNPPSGSKDLVVTSNAGDTDPTLFELGDTYDITWGGAGGGGSIEDAVVVRSDAAPGGGGIIVFEGLDENGVIAQVIWTPGFDLEGWYNANYNPSMEPQFWTEDQNAAYTHSFVCFAAETRIRTASGHVCAGDLRAGDRVWTLDAGPVPVLWTGRRRTLGAGPDAPVVFDAGTLGNACPLRLSQQHRVLVRSALVQLYFGIDAAMAPAKALVNGRDIRIAPCAAVEYVHILLAAHHVVSAEGALCESLFLRDEALRMLYDDPALAMLLAVRPAAVRHTSPVRPILTYAEARLLANAPLPAAAAAPLPAAAAAPLPVPVV